MEYRLEQTHAIHELPMQTYTHEQVAFIVPFYVMLSSTQRSL